MDEISQQEKNECRCHDSLTSKEIAINLDKQTAIELAKFTSTYAPLVREVAFACEAALRRIHNSSTSERNA